MTSKNNSWRPREIPNVKRLLFVAASMFLLFMLFSFVGWCYESLNDFLVRGGFHWRSSLAGPWCPIYGVGGLLILAAFLPLDKAMKKREMPTALRVLLLAIGIYVLVTVVELAGSYMCEATMGYMPWDYSSSWGNFEGRIAPEFTIRFVIGGLVFLWATPYVLKWMGKHKVAVIALSAVLAVLFAADNCLESAGVWADVLPRDSEVFVK